MDKPEKKEVDRIKHQGSSIGYQKSGQTLHLTPYQNGYNKACDDWEAHIKEHYVSKEKYKEMEDCKRRYQLKLGEEVTKLDALKDKLLSEEEIMKTIVDEDVKEDR